MRYFRANRFTVGTFIVLAGSGSAFAATFPPPYTAAYSQTSFSTGIPTAVFLGGLAFLPSDPNTLLVGEPDAGGIFAFHVTRDASLHITGVTGSPTLFAAAPSIEDSLTFGPGNVLFYGGTSTVSEIKPGSTSPDKVVTLAVADGGSGTNIISGLAFIPGNPSSLDLVVHGGELYSTDVSADGTGAYNMTNLSAVAFIGSEANAINFITPGQPDIPGSALMFNGQGGPSIQVFALDSANTPTTDSVFYMPVSAAGGTFDPLSGDYIYSDVAQSTQLHEIRGFVAAPEPASLSLLAAGSLLLVRRRRR